MLRPVLVSVVVILAGCFAPFPGNGEMTPMRTESPAHTTESTAKLHILSQGPFSLTILEYGPNGQEVVLNESFSGITSVDYDGSGGVFQEGADYRVVIRVNETVRWNRTISQSDQYDLAIADNGTVTVRSHGQD